MYLYLYIYVKDVEMFLYHRNYLYFAVDGRVTLRGKVQSDQTVGQSQEQTVRNHCQRESATKVIDD